MNDVGPSAAKPFATLLLTGAAGALGQSLAPALSCLCTRLLLSDLGGPLAATPLPARAEAAPCDLGDPVAVHQLLQGVDAVVHLGGVSVERPFEEVLPANIRGVFHLYEAARRHGTRRIVFASSNHVTGCYDKAQTVSPQDPPRPDGYYGLSKLYGEGMASLYWDRYGIETVCLRIGSALPQPRDHRGLYTWLSLPDLARLVTAALTAPDVGFVVAYGISNNTRRWWDTEAAWARLHYSPQDDSEVYAAQVQHVRQPEGSPSALKQGGVFLAVGPFDDHPPD